MKRFVSFISAFPFSGKVIIRSRVYKFYQSRTKEEQKRNYLFLIALLIFSFFGHTAQAAMGVQLIFHSPLWLKALSSLYTAANICVILVQIYIGYRVTSFLSKNLSARGKRLVPKYTTAEIVGMVAATWGGQIIFLSLYFLYR